MSKFLDEAGVEHLLQQINENVATKAYVDDAIAAIASASGEVSAVKSIQYGTAQIASNNNSASVSIDSVDLQRSFAFVQGSGIEKQYTASLTPYIASRTNTALTINTFKSVNSTFIFSWCVIEFY